MRLSAAFNFFDGGELLVHSVASIRPHVDHISVVTQNISNYGNPQSNVSTNALEELLRSGFVDDIEHYSPDLNLGGGQNEFRKRRRGLDLARTAGASHYLFVDADEFYEAEAFDSARRAVAEFGWESTTVPFVNYYGTPTRRLRGTAGYVPFICSLTAAHEFAAQHPRVPVDPTRSVTVHEGSHHIFHPSEIVMHHMTGVRRDLDEKLANSSQNDDPKIIDLMRTRLHLGSAISPGRHILPEGLEIHLDTVEDLFGLSGSLGEGP